MTQLCMSTLRKILRSQCKSVLMRVVTFFKNIKKYQKFYVYIRYVDYVCVCVCSYD